MLTPFRIALAIFVIAFATIAGAWIFEYAGYLPCELCLQQRWAYYIGVPVAALTVASTVSGKPSPIAKLLFVLLALIFIGSAIFGAYHAGVEWGFWEGPTGCTGAIPQRASDMSDFMRQLETTKVVRCDAVAIRILGLSLAGWNAVISAVLAVLALRTVSRA
ncbi:MAG: disulfide bond formation protein DsbB [Rhizobiales bacterium 62-17]|nr:disulfide bond formation protein B [Hyphomicrobiales bacterium]OJX99707.1 MAG: disulfide bond formation protein DsbB [Rhizobiales bacterium 62-17]